MQLDVSRVCRGLKQSIRKEISDWKQKNREASTLVVGSPVFKELHG